MVEQTPTLLLEASEPEDIQRETLKLMRNLVRTGKRDPSIRDVACDIIRDCPAKDTRCEIQTLWRWVADNIRYTDDVAGIETISDAQGVLDRGYGDCDDMSVLLATFLETIGKPTRFVAFGHAPGFYEHVIVEVRMGPGWFPVDATEPKRGFGWRPPMRAEMIMHNR